MRTYLFKQGNIAHLEDGEEGGESGEESGKESSNDSGDGSLGLGKMNK